MSPQSNNLYFRITIIDESTGRGIPLVRVCPLNNAVYYTDSAGIVAFHEPGYSDQAVFVEVSSDGYEVIPDGTGAKNGLTLHVTPGGSATIKMKRLMPAQRIYRITGAEIYRDSLLLGDNVPIERSGLNAQVTGLDSTHMVRYKDHLFWIWGDTMSPRYHSHWNFKVTGATSELPGNGGLDPDQGINLNYFTKQDGFVKQMAPLEGHYLYWLWGLVAAKDETGRERLLSTYMKIQAGNLRGDRVEEDDKKEEKKSGRPEDSTEKERKKNFPAFSMVAYGMVEFDDEKQIFEKLWEHNVGELPMINFGHPFRHQDNGTDYLYYPSAVPNVRIKDDVESLLNPESWEAFTCLKEGSRFNNTGEQLDRTPDGSLHYSWKKNTSPISPGEQAQLIAAGHIKPEEGWIHFRETDTGKPVGTQHNSVNYNPYRDRWIMLTSQGGGTSALGEVLYAEADTPVGPWVYTKKVVTHDNYSFYNPVQHDVFDKDGGRVIYFEGTYTRSFSSNPVSTPRYNYNQIMYKMELDDPRLFLPVPVYYLESEPFAYRTKKDIPSSSTAKRSIPFFAPDRPRENTIPVFTYMDPKSSTAVLALANPNLPADAVQIAFYAEAANADSESGATVPLYEYTDAKTNKRIYTTKDTSETSGLQKNERPLCRVWENPSTFNPF